MSRPTNNNKAYFRYNMLITSINLLQVSEEEQQELIEQLDELVDLLMKGARLDDEDEVQRDRQK